MTELMTPKALIASVADVVIGLPACIAGSSVAAQVYDLPLGKYADVDVFCYSSEAVISGVERLVHEGYEIEERSSRVWSRWLRTGMQGWHTNSIKLLEPVTEAEVNLVYKLVNKHPLTSLSQVLESFDFGLLGVGYDMETGVLQDLRPFMFGQYGLDPSGPLPLMPKRREAWRQGFMSQYQGIRQVGRYAKYARYGHDMSMVKDDLIEGYTNAALYFMGRTEPDKIMTGNIYNAIAEKMLVDDIDELSKVGAMIVDLDGLDAIMEALE